MPWFSLHEDCYDPFNGYAKGEQYKKANGKVHLYTWTNAQTVRS